MKVLVFFISINKLKKVLYFNSLFLETKALNILLITLKTFFTQTTVYLLCLNIFFLMLLVLTLAQDKKVLSLKLLIEKS